MLCQSCVEARLDTPWKHADESSDCFTLVYLDRFMAFVKLVHSISG